MSQALVRITPEPIVIADSPAVAYLATLGPKSRKTQAVALRTICRILGDAAGNPASFPWQQVTYAHAAALRQALGARYAPATTNRLLAAWRGVLRAAWRLGVMSDAAYLRAVDVKDVRKSDVLRGRALPAEELALLFASAQCDPRPLGRRDGALLVCLYACGLRRAEAAGLGLSDLTADGLRVRGKGGKVRLVPVPPDYLPILQDYAAELSEGPLLRAVDKDSGELTAAPMTPSGVAKAVASRIHMAQIRVATPHDLRRSYITDLLGHGVDVLTVADLAGHARLDTTRRYDHRPHEARVAAVTVLRKGE